MSAEVAALLALQLMLYTDECGQNSRCAVMEMRMWIQQVFLL